MLDRLVPHVSQIVMALSSSGSVPVVTLLPRLFLLAVIGFTQHSATYCNRGLIGYNLIIRIIDNNKKNVLLLGQSFFQK